MIFNYTDAFVTLAALDFERLVQFYGQLLGQKPNPYLPQIYAEFQLTGLRLGIFKPQSSQQTEFSDSVGSGMSLCWEVENLEAAIAHFTNLGYPPLEKIRITSHGQEIYAYDPAGNRLILHQSREVRDD
jgi:predicted enzyme related to lactoylglutathione lyase